MRETSDQKNDFSFIESYITLGDNFPESDLLNTFIPGFYIFNSSGRVVYLHSEFEIELESSIEIVDPSEFENLIFSGYDTNEIGSWLGEYDFDIWKKIKISKGIFNK